MKIMKGFVKINSFLLGSLLLLLGCYDDKGSYNYHDINEINIENITLNTLGVPLGNITFIQLKNVNILINTNIIYLIPLHLLLYS